jgi:integrase
MAKALKEKSVTTREARAKLESGIHWRDVDGGGVHLGYRRGRRGGEWLVRWRSGVGYRRRSIGAADDVLTADGISTFNFQQALTATRRIVEAERATAAVAAAGPVPTVRSAVEAYLVEREVNEALQRGGKPLKRDARSRLSRHVLAKDLAATPLHKLEEDTLKEWRSGLAGLAPASVRRTVNDFKAALNKAADEKRKALPALAGVIKAAFKAKGATASIARQFLPLSDDEVRTVIAAAAEVDAAGGWEGDLYRMVLLLAATGARFGQVAAIQVGDVESVSERIMVPVSFKGRGEKQSAAYPVHIGGDVIRALRPAMAGRKSGESLLERWRHKQTGPAEWKRERRAPWQSASEMLRPWAKIIAKAELSAEAVPYILRHSSIVRGLRAGLSVRHVAVLHDTSAKMIEAHYSKWIADAETEAARRAIVSLAAAPALHAAE